MEETQETQEVRYAPEKMVPKQDVGRSEDVFEQHIELSYEEVVAPPGKTVLPLSEVYDEGMSQRDKTSELKGKTSVPDTAKKEAKPSKHKLVPETQEATVVGEDNIRKVPTLPDKPLKERTEEVMVIPERKKDSLHEANILFEKQRQMALEEKRVREQDTVKTEDRDKDKGSIEVKISTDEPKPPVIISTDAGSDERRVFTEKSVKHDDLIASTTPKEKDRRLEQVTEMIKEAEKVPAKHRPVQVAPSQMKKVTEDVSRVVETQIKPTVITDFSRETILEDLSLIKPEAAQELQSDITFKKKGVSRVGGSPEEKWIQEKPDIELKKPKVIQQDPSVFSTKTEEKERKGEKIRYRLVKKEESVMEMVAETKPLVPLKSAEKKRPSPQTAARGIKRLVEPLLFVVEPLHILFFNPSKRYSFMFYALSPNHLHKPSLFCYFWLFFPNELFFLSSFFFPTKSVHVT